MAREAAMTEKKIETKRFLNMHKRLETAIMDYGMIREGDKIIVGLSGGKDSSMLLRLLARKKVEIKQGFELHAAFVKQGYRGDDEKIEYLRSYSESFGVPFHVIDAPILETFKREKKKPCYLCSRGRRLAIFNFADAIGAGVIAFGHHKDDFIETLLLNLFYGNTIGTMKPLNTFFKEKYRVIRPMLYVEEWMIKAESKEIKTFPAGCPFECVSERSFTRDIINQIHKHRPQSKRSMFRAMFSCNSEYLLKPPSRDCML